MTAWLATLIGSIVTLFLGVVVWGMQLLLDRMFVAAQVARPCGM